MKAYIVSKYKSPMHAGEVAEPTVGDHDVLIDIHAAGVNMLDAKIRDGEFKLILPHKPPFILGHDLAGVVTRVGSAVTRFTAGDGDPLGEGADASVRLDLSEAHRRLRPLDRAGAAAPPGDGSSAELGDRA